MVEILGACYKLDVLDCDRQGLESFLSTPYAQGFREAASLALPGYKHASQQCFISRKYAEYLTLLLK